MLATTDYDGPADAPPLLIAHGLFGSARNWSSVAKALSDGRRVRAVDMRNHGGSFHDARHDYEAMAEDLAAAIDGEADVLGHSMGGKAAMVLALTRPDLVRRLIVVDIAPVAYDHNQIDLVRAMQAVPLDSITTRRDADSALAETVDDPRIRGFLLHSLDVRAKRWSLNLDALGDQMAEVLDFPDVSAAFEGRTLFLRGEASDYVTDAHRDRIDALFPDSTVVTIKDAGHWIHAEAPDAVIGAVNEFLIR